MSEKNAAVGEEVDFFHPDLFVVPENGEAPYLMGYKCENCGKVWFPKLELCPGCWSDLNQIKLSRQGTLYSYSVIHIGQPGIKTPYVVGYIDFPENVRIYGQLEIEPDKVKTGIPVEVISGVVRTDKVGNPKMISYKFKAI
ncbi:MAG: OB-fold domain-containing protein [Clostridia bacterium]|nr:OB-fold domain-containing protein [Clostridia bacterium]